MITKVINNLMNHEIWKFCCNSWFDRRNEYYCPKCGKK